jgi:ATP dependent DNA ligase domain
MPPRNSAVASFRLYRALPYPLIREAYKPAQGALVPGRRRGRRLRRERARGVRAAAAQAGRAARAFLFAIDLLELDGEDLRRASFETRKATLANLLRGCLPGLRLNEHLAYPGNVVFKHACKMGLEGIVSKRLGSRYVSGRTRDWLKMKNPEALAVKREAEGDWGN